MTFLFRPQEYHRPKNLREATFLLFKLGEKGAVIAGGTDLLIQKPEGIQCIVDISGLGLDYIKNNEEGFSIGASTPISSVQAYPFFCTGPYILLSEAAENLATATIRNRATVGGNLCNASPAADLAVPLLVLDATLIAIGPKGEREIPIDEFFRDVNITVLSKGEVLKEVRIPSSPKNVGTCFIKLRRHMTAIDIAVVNVATCVVCRKGICEDAKIALGAVAPRPIRARSAEALLEKKRVSEQVIEEVSRAAAADSKPIDDIRASAAYRKLMVEVLVRRALENSFRRCI